MFELYNYENKIPKEKYEFIYKIIVDNYFERNKELRSNRDQIDTKEAYINWTNTILNTPNYYILLFYKDDTIAGFVNYMLDKDILFICEIQFSQKYKNKGYLKQLLKEVINVSKKYKYNKISLMINKNNKISINVFKHIGFKNIRDNYYEISKCLLIDYLEKNKT